MDNKFTTLTHSLYKDYIYRWLVSQYATNVQDTRTIWVVSDVFIDIVSIYSEWEDNFNHCREQFKGQSAFQCVNYVELDV